MVKLKDTYVVTNETIKEVLKKNASKLKMTDGGIYMFLPCWFEVDDFELKGEVNLAYTGTLRTLPEATRRHMIEEVEEFLNYLKDEK